MLAAPTLRALLLLGLLSASPALAHHGRDFLLARTASLPHHGELYGIPRLDFVDRGEEGEIEFEPTLLYGISPWIAGELHFHIAKEGDQDADLESVAPAVHLRFTPEASPWALGLSLEFENSLDDRLENVIETALILSRETAAAKFAANIVAEDEQGPEGSVEWAYSFAFRRRLGPALDLGVEVLGDLEEPGDGEVLLGFYLQPSRRLTLNLGIGTGYGEREVDLSLRSALAFRIGS